MHSAVDAAPRAVRLERRDDATCLGTATPLLSWRRPPGAGPQRGVQVQLRDAAPGGRDLSWSARTEESVLVPWAGEPLHSGQRGLLRVRTEHDGGVSPWSDPVRVHVAPLAPSDWRARFISPAVGGGLDDPAPVLAGVVRIGTDLVHARLLVSALGAVRMQVNGQRVGADVLTPGWTSYAHRVRFHGYDVTALLTPGENTLRATLGNGWYRGALTRELRRDLYGSHLGLLAQLELSYADGRVETVCADETWRAYTGPVRADDLDGGQHTGEAVLAHQVLRALAHRIAATGTVLRPVRQRAAHRGPAQNRQRGDHRQHPAPTPLVRLIRGGDVSTIGHGVPSNRAALTTP